MNREAVLGAVREILVDNFDVPAHKVTEEATFRGTLGMDSHSTVDFVFLLGETFGIPTEVEVFRELYTVGNVVSLILSLNPQGNSARV